MNERAGGGGAFVSICVYVTLLAKEHKSMSAYMYGHAAENTVVCMPMNVYCDPVYLCEHVSTYVYV